MLAERRTSHRTSPDLPRVPCQESVIRERGRDDDRRSRGNRGGRDTRNDGGGAYRCRAALDFGRVSLEDERGMVEPFLRGEREERCADLRNEARDLRILRGVDIGLRGGQNYSVLWRSAVDEPDR